MKVKVKVDKKAILDFLLKHAEKIVFGVVVLVFMLMLYSAASGAKRFDKTPQELQTQVDTGRRTINETKPDVSLALVDYAAQAKRSRIAVEEKPYQTAVRWDQPLFDKKSLRDAPPLLAVQELRGAPGVGAFHIAQVPESEAKTETPEAKPAAATKSTTAGKRRGEPGVDMMMLDQPVAMAGGGNDVRGRRWIVLTGLVPFEEQETAYANAFKQAAGYDPQIDRPTYWGYWVQRLEVTGSSDTEKLDWDKAEEFMSSKAETAAINEWSQMSNMDVVSPQYLLEQNPDRLTFPLGPLVYRPWDKSVAHEPKIPLLQQAGGMEMGLGGEFRNIRGQMRGDEMMRGPDDLTGGRAGASKDNPFFNATNPNATAANPDLQPGAEEKLEPLRKLFRFFDFSVKPGKRYVYRVRLALANPNRNVKTAYLAKPDLAEKPFLTTSWSEPTPVIAVPCDSRVLAVSVKPTGSRATGDPTGRILLVKWVKMKGVEAFAEFGAVRGQMANFFDNAKISIGSHGATSPGGGPEFGGGPGPAGGALKVHFQSNITTLDFRGGERLYGGGENALNAVGEMLLMDADGRLSVRDELDDKPIRDEIAVTAPEEKSRPMMEEMFMDPEMRGPGARRTKGGLDLLNPRDTTKKSRTNRNGP